MPDLGEKMEAQALLYTASATPSLGGVAPRYECLNQTANLPLFVKPVITMSS